MNKITLEKTIEDLKDTFRSTANRTVKPASTTSVPGDEVPSVQERAAASGTQPVGDDLATVDQKEPSTSKLPQQQTSQGMTEGSQADEE